MEEEGTFSRPHSKSDAQLRLELRPLLSPSPALPSGLWTAFRAEAEGKDRHRVCLMLNSVAGPHTHMDSFHPLNNPGGENQSPQYTHGETEAQREEGTCPESYMWPYLK